MISYSQALAILNEVGSRRSLLPIRRSILESAGFVLAEDVNGNEAVPSFDNSAMDGFALNSAWTRDASSAHPVRLSVAQCITAGDAVVLQNPASVSAVQIMTGAPMPGAGSVSQYNSVIKIEEVKVLKESHGLALEIEISRPVSAGENVRKSGEDFLPGQLVAKKGTVILPEHIMAMASLGISEVKVFPKPKVGIISTGKELVEATTESLTPGMIRNSTGPYLRSVAPLFGCEAQFLGVIPDDSKTFEDLIRSKSAQFDILITTGAVSMGIHDFVGESLKRLGAQIHFHKAAIRPGKPVLFGELENGCTVFGAPGNPVSTSVCWRFFVAPYLRALTRRSAEQPFRGVLSKDMHKPEGLRCFFKAKVDFTHGHLKAECLKGQASFMVSPLLVSNAWVVLPETGAEAKAGSEIELYPLYPAEDLFREMTQSRGLHSHHQECCS